MLPEKHQKWFNKFNMGRLSKTKIKTALTKTKGAVYLAAKSLGVSPPTVYKYINKYQDLADLKDSFDGEMVDVAELKLRETVFSGDPWALKYVLSTKGKHRGWTEKVDDDPGDDKSTQPVKVNMVVENADD